MHRFKRHGKLHAAPNMRNWGLRKEGHQQECLKEQDTSAVTSLVMMKREWRGEQRMPATQETIPQSFYLIHGCWEGVQKLGPTDGRMLSANVARISSRQRPAHSILAGEAQGKSRASGEA